MRIRAPLPTGKGRFPITHALHQNLPRDVRIQREFRLPDSQYARGLLLQQHDISARDQSEDGKRVVA